MLEYIPRSRRISINVMLRQHELSRLVGEIPNLEFDIFGEGDFLDKCIDTSRRLGIANRINFRGVVAFDDIIDDGD